MGAKHEFLFLSSAPEEGVGLEPESSPSSSAPPKGRLWNEHAHGPTQGSVAEAQSPEKQARLSGKLAPHPVPEPGPR